MKQTTITTSFRILVLLSLPFFLFSCVTNTQLKPPESKNEITVVVDFMSIEGYFYEGVIPSQEVAKVVANEVCENKEFYEFTITSRTQGLSKFSAGCSIDEGESFKSLTFYRRSAGQYNVSQIQGFSL
ncbi:hypothetical protein [Glaciecola petra]|uniref:Lipoprotein n=1 Tax=Glaciecola petra TaxID=3075602 RepID=A0ABU2ZRC5_9ALTE|nr:hypothetical protein [Aestuariibacter sp. P117]MDT0595180.1 hypothetical protein [Aestuariibacter sp. P117]